MEIEIGARLHGIVQAMVTALELTSRSVIGSHWRAVSKDQHVVMLCFVKISLVNTKN